MDDELDPGDTWYVVVDGGDPPEQAFTTPFRAHMVLDKLGVAGHIDAYNAATGRRELKASREASGLWTTPQEVV